MGVTKSDTSNLANAQKIMLASMRFTMEFKGIAKQLVENIPLKKGHKNVTVNKYGTITARALTEGVEIVDAQELTNTTLTITPGEVGLKSIITLKLIRQGMDNVHRSTGTILGNAMNKKQDQDIVANFDNFAKTTPGAGSALNWTHLLAARSYIETGGTTNEPPPDTVGIHGCLHPEQIADVVADVAVRGTYPVPTGYSDELIRNYWRGRDKAYGMNLFVDGNIARDSSDDAKGAVFHRSAIIYVESQAIETFEEFKAALRGWEMVSVSDYAEGEYKDEWGFEVYSDAAARV